MSRLFVESRPRPIRSSLPVHFGMPGEGLHDFRVRVPDGAESLLRHELGTDRERSDFLLLASGREDRN